MTRIETDMKYVSKSLDETKEILVKFIEKADEKYSSKWVERAVIAMALTLFTAVLGLIFTKLK